MNDESLVGINEGKLDSLILQIHDYAERINNKFNLLEQLVYDSQSFFQCDVGDEFRTKFGETKSNFTIVNKNILNIASDLVRVKENYINTNDKAIDNFNKSGSEVLSNSIDRYKMEK